MTIKMTSRVSSETFSVKSFVQFIVIAGILSVFVYPVTTADRERVIRRNGRSRRRWKEGDIRLVGGANRTQGTILMYHKGKWGAVCDDDWNVSNADVVCRQQGFPGSARLTTKQEFGGRAKRRIWITRVQCQGHEQRLLSCNYLGWGFRIKHMCPGVWRSAGVVCQPKQKRRNRKTQAERRAWRRNNPQKWLARRKARAEAKKRKAAAAKRRKLKEKRKKKQKQKPTRKPGTKNPAARNRTRNLPEGQRRENVISKSEDFNLDRIGDPVSSNVPDNFNVRLEGEASEENNVLIPWAMVEGPLEGDDDARRELAHERNGPLTTTTVTSPTTSSTTSTTTTPTTTTTSTTTTTTPTTTSSTTTPTSTTTSTTTTTPTTSTTSTTTTTSATTDMPTTTTSSSTTMSSTNDPSTTVIVASSSPTTTLYPSTTSDVPQTTTETTSGTSTESETTEKSVVDLTKTKAAGDITLQGNGLKSEDALLLQADSPSNPELELKLVGGRYPWEGLLELREKLEDPGPWGTVCAEHWGMKETMVVCRQMGLNYAKQPLRTNYFGGHDRDKIYYSFKCTGREAKLSDCPAVKISHDVTCPKQKLVAGVVCATFLPDLIPNLRALSDSARLQDRPLYYLQCALEENCLSSSAYEIRNNSKTWRNNMRRLLRFSTIVHNRGDADFRPYVAKGQWEWHACHMHYHSMEVFAHYDIMDENGTRLAEGSKASFCLEDTTCDRGVSRKFQCAGFGDQGLSVNCSDNYLWDIDCQWIDITDIEPGTYTFLLEVNPSMLVAEIDYDNNVARCDLWYSGYFAKFTNCRHESLLDYRR